MTKPLSQFDVTSDEATEHPSTVAWAGILDKRYCIEVQRTKPYKGNFCVFDSQNNMDCIFEEAVDVSYDALFGPDIVDVNTWQNKAADFIDNKYNK